MDGERRIAEDEDYFWRVRCQDGYESGTWSPTAVFLVVPAYVCGDAVYPINYSFKGSPELLCP